MPVGFSMKIDIIIQLFYREALEALSVHPYGSPHNRYNFAAYSMSLCAAMTARFLSNDSLEAGPNDAISLLDT
jgi:hypothetical protein